LSKIGNVSNDKARCIQLHIEQSKRGDHPVTSPFRRSHPDGGAFRTSEAGASTSPVLGSFGCGSTGATRITIFNCFGSVVDWRGWRLPPVLVPEVPGERPLGVRDDSVSLTRFSDEAVGSCSFIILFG